MDKKNGKEKMIIALGADHAAFEEKEQIKGFLEGCGHIVIDKGTHTADSVDYPEFGHAVGKTVVNGEAEKGIVICGSGIGISISANKVNGIRAALCNTVEHAILSRQHNDANVLAMGARLTEFSLLEKIITAWLETPFEGGRHQRRVEKIEL
jgi:ribose 5-phosphate isomerase B